MADVIAFPAIHGRAMVSATSPSNSAKSGRSSRAGIPVFSEIANSKRRSGLRSPLSHLETVARDTPSSLAKSAGESCVASLNSLSGWSVMQTMLPNRQRECQVARCQIGHRPAVGAGTIVTGMAKRAHKKSKGPLLLTEWMVEQGETDITLAQALGVSRETVWKWQASPTRLNPLKQAQVARALRIWPALLWVEPGTPIAKMMLALFEMHAPAPAKPERKVARK